ncbi:MAG TPA: discoidin domain-containing protein [Microlunatus sp.]
MMDAGISIGDFLRRYTVQVSDDGRSWTDIAMGPGRPSLTGEMVIALPSTTARHLRLVSGATAGSWWSIHELNLRTVAGSAEPGRPGAGLVAATGRLPDGTWVGGYYNAGSTAAEVPWPIDGFGYTYRLPPTAAVTFALPGTQVTSHQTRRTGFHPGEAGHGITHR